MRTLLAVPCLMLSSLALLTAQELRDFTIDGKAVACRVHEPPKRGPDGFAPLALLCGDGTDAIASSLVAEGVVVVRPPAPLPGLPAVLRQQFAITRGGIDLVALAPAAADALHLAVAEPWEFRSVTMIDAAPSALSAPEQARLRGRPLASLAAGELPAHLRNLRATAEPDGAAGEVAHALDRFHDAAAKGDEDVYFALLPDDAVFLGTDGTERWTGAGFRKFALPYFRRGPAWIYVPTARHVAVLPGGDVATFDEMLDNEAYGECRGSGVLARRDGRWVVLQYNLSVPIPNDLARAFVARIRAFAASAPPPCTTIVIVRHAEKVADGSRDPGLTAAGTARAERLAQLLGDVPVQAVFATEFRRTQATVAPLARARGLEPRIVNARDTAALAHTLRREFATGTAVVAAHSDTIPALLQSLGITDHVAIADDAYDDLFIVTLDLGDARMLHLRM
ncbi:MAG: nuclear transport factor 2 family protein [Planctomycetota bacterium]